MPKAIEAAFDRDFGDKAIERAKVEAKWLRYRTDPVAYAAEIHGIWLWSRQAEAMRALAKPPHRVMIESCNGAGKTLLAGVAAAWFYDTFDPGICTITGPRMDQVRDTTFKEIRRLLSSRPGMYPKLPRLEDTPDHYINGTTAAASVAFQGIHGPNLAMVFEEAVGIDMEFWTATRGILIGGTNTFWLAIDNPTDASSHAYIERNSGYWTVIRISAFEHPNIHANLLGLVDPIPGAVSLSRIRADMASEGWGQFVSDDDATILDVDLWAAETYGFPTEPGAMWPVRIGGQDVYVAVAALLDGARAQFPRRYWRPGPIGDARILGRYPSRSAYAIFSEAAFDLACRVDLKWQESDRVVFGCDVARHGDDHTTIHGRRGPVSIHHEAYHGQDTGWTAGRLKQLCRYFGGIHSQRPEKIACNIDDAGVGGGVVDQRFVDATDEQRSAGTFSTAFNFVPVNAAWVASEPDRYPNVRSELWFTTAEMMAEGRICLKHLPAEDVATLRRQAVQVNYRIDGSGRRVADEKKVTKKALGRSPDDMDSFNLAYYRGNRSIGVVTPVDVPVVNLYLATHQDLPALLPPGDGDGSRRDRDRRDHGGTSATPPRGIDPFPEIHLFR